MTFSRADAPRVRVDVSNATSSLVDAAPEASNAGDVAVVPVVPIYVAEGLMEPVDPVHVMAGYYLQHAEFPVHLLH